MSPAWPLVPARSEGFEAQVGQDPAPLQKAVAERQEKDTMNRFSNATGWALSTALCGALFLEGCGNDRDESRKTDAGTDGAASGGSGGTASGGTPGTGGQATGGASSGGRDAGITADAGTGGREGGAVSDGGPDGARDSGTGPAPCLYADAPQVDAGDAGAATGVLLVAGTDYFSTTEVAAVELPSGNVLGRSTFADGDAVVEASAGQGFVIERTSGAVDVLSPTGSVERRIPLDALDAGTHSNPHHVVMLPGSAPKKAYVSLYDGNGVAVVDVDQGTVLRVIDLTSLSDAGDTDGKLEVDSSLYDAATGRVYFALERIDRNTILPPNYQLACPAAPGLVIAVDPATDTLVDLNGGDAGVGFRLSLENHGGMVRDPATGKALLVAYGCAPAGDGGGGLAKGGIESLDLATGQSEVLLTAPGNTAPNGLLVLAPGDAVVQSYLNGFEEVWNAWSPTSTTLGATLSCVPSAAVGSSADQLVGVAFTPGGAEIVGYRVSTGAGTVIAKSPWQGSFDYVANAAIVR